MVLEPKDWPGAEQGMERVPSLSLAREDNASAVGFSRLGKGTARTTYAAAGLDTKHRRPSQIPSSASPARDRPERWSTSPAPSRRKQSGSASHRWRHFGRCEWTAMRPFSHARDSGLGSITLPRVLLGEILECSSGTRRTGSPQSALP